MSAKVIDGKAVAQRVKDEVAKGVIELVEKYGEPACPYLALVLCGSDPVSARLVEMKKRDCESVGIAAAIFRVPESAGQSALLELIAKLDGDENVTGILCQLPLPEGFDTRAVIHAISPAKDADGFSARLDSTKDDICACTPAGVIRLLEEYGVEIAGAEAVVIGRSNIVGKPMALQLMLRGATVTVCHTLTGDLAAHTRSADIIICAAGSPHLITADMVKPGAVVIDVGVTYGDSGIVGDVDFEEVSAVASAITPCVGGVGPMTRAMLLHNTLRLAQMQAEGCCKER